MIDCKHLGVSEEAYRVEAATGRETRAIVHLCRWEEANQTALLNAPPWLIRMIGNCAVDPHKDCVNCPSYEPLNRPATLSEKEERS